MARGLPLAEAWGYSELGVFLVNEPKESKDSVTAELVLSGGVVATAAFESPWPLATGGYYDVEKATRDGETAFIQVATLGRGESLAKLPAAWFGQQLFTTEGRYGAYGAPADIKVKPSAEGELTYDLSFSTLTPGGSDTPRRGIGRRAWGAGSWGRQARPCGLRR